MEIDNEKLKKFCESKHLQVGHFNGEVLMNVGKDNEVLLFKRDGTHEYVSKERFERMLNRKRDPRPDKDISLNRAELNLGMPEYIDILYSNMKIL